MALASQGTAWAREPGEWQEARTARVRERMLMGKTGVGRELAGPGLPAFEAW